MERKEPEPLLGGQMDQFTPEEWQSLREDERERRERAERELEPIREHQRELAQKQDEEEGRERIRLHKLAETLARRAEASAAKTEKERG